MSLAKAEKARMSNEAESEYLPADRVLLLRFQRRVCSGFDVMRRNSIAGCIGEESDISCFSVRRLGVLSSP